MVEGINLWPGPSLCITAEITAVVGCQHAGLHTARLPPPADFAPHESGRRSRKAQPDCVFTTRELCTKPGQEATGLDGSSAPADASVSLAATCIGTTRAVLRTPLPSLTPSGESGFCPPSPCRDRRRYAGGMGSGQSRRRVGRASTGARGHDAFRPRPSDQTCRMSTCSTTSKLHAPEGGAPLFRQVAAATDVGIVSVPANVAPQGANTL
jgi:hypothetical protein